MKLLFNFHINVYIINSFNNITIHTNWTLEANDYFRIFSRCFKHLWLVLSSPCVYDCLFACLFVCFPVCHHQMLYRTHLLCELPQRRFSAQHFVCLRTDFANTIVKLQSQNFDDWSIYWTHILFIGSVISSELFDQLKQRWFLQKKVCLLCTDMLCPAISWGVCSDFLQVNQKNPEGKTQTFGHCVRGTKEKAPCNCNKGKKHVGHL